MVIFLWALGWGFRQLGNFLKSYRDACRWKDALGCNFSHSCYNNKRKGEWRSLFVRVITSKFPRKYQTKHILKPLLYATGYIVVMAIIIFEINHPWCRVKKFSSYPSLHSSYTTTDLLPLHCSPWLPHILAQSASHCWALRQALVLAHCSPPPLWFPPDSWHPIYLLPSK